MSPYAAPILSSPSADPSTYTPLVDIRDLPFSISRIPDVFTPFRKEVEGANRKLGREPLVMPTTFKPFPGPKVASPNPSYGKEFDNCKVEELIPYLLAPIKSEYHAAASADDYKRDSRSAFPYSGGETSALARLDWYFHQGSPPPVARYKVCFALFQCPLALTFCLTSTGLLHRKLEMDCWELIIVPNSLHSFVSANSHPD